MVVTVNYRISILGFLALDDGVTNGNFGIQDQMTALEWVQNRNQAFGGNPKQITVFGRLAGAASVRALLASPKTAEKFQAAIAQSNIGGGGHGTTAGTNHPTTNPNPLSTTCPYINQSPPERPQPKTTSNATAGNSSTRLVI